MSWWRRFSEQVLERPQYGAALAVAVAVYFAASRFLQDWLYHTFGLARSAPDLFASFSRLSQPEPLEAALYLAGYLVIPLLAWFLYSGLRRVPKVSPGALRLLLLMVAVSGVLLVAWRLSRINFSFYLDYLATAGFSQALWLLFTKRIFITTLILLVSAAVFVWFLFSRRRPGFAWLRRTAAYPGWGKFEAFLVFAIALAVFHPNFPLDPHHYNFFLGSVNDMLYGKALLYETTHLYGLFDVYFLAFVFTYLLPLTYPMAALIITFFFGAFFVGMYLFIKQWLHSRLLAMVGIFCLYSILYLFQTSPTRSALFFPAMTPLRYGWYLLILFLLLAFSKTGRPIWRTGAIFCSAVALFWVFDAGLYVVAASFLAFAYCATRSASRPVLVLLRLAGQYALAIGVVAALVGLVNAAVFGVLPNWALIWREVAHFGAGIGMTPLPALGVFEVMVFLYLVVGLVLFSEHQQGRTLDLPLVFLFFFGIFNLLYYVGESSWQNLYLTTGPLVLVLLYFFKHYALGDEVRLEPAWSSRTLTAAAYALVCLAALLFIAKAPVEFAGRDYRRISESLSGFGERELSWRAEYEDGRTMARRYPQLKRLAVISPRDTQVLISAERPNALDSYYLFNIFFASQMDALAMQTRAEPPPYLFVAREPNDQVQYFMARVQERYDKVETLRTLDVYRLKVARPTG
ncbi:hypothetical protein HYW67_03065 [Candidatus Parcubacteria bacterium]|nr:hypothetical protein [Candidatus Parcubacteria bacterium]